MPDQPATILLVIADEFEALVRAALAQAGGGSFAVVRAPSATEALALLRSREWSLVLLDHALLGDAVFRFPAQARNVGATAPVVVLTAASERAVHAQLLAAGAVDYLEQQRLDPDRLERTLRYALAHATQRRTIHALETRLHEIVRLSDTSHWRIETHVPVPIDLPEDAQIAQFYRDGFMAQADDATARGLGLERADQLIGAPISRLLPPSDPKSGETLRQFIRSGYRLRRTRTVEREAGTPSIVLEIHWYSHVENGRLMHVAGSQKDITAQRQAEGRLAELAAIVETSSDTITSAGVDGTVRSWNHGAEQLFGYTAAEIVGRSFLTVVPPALRETTLQHYSQLTVSSTPVTYDATMLHKDGRPLDVALTVSPLLDADDRIAGIAMIGRDISEARRAAAQLAESEQRFRVVLDHSREAIYQFNLDAGQYDYTSPSFVEVLGYTPEEMAAGGMAFSLSMVHPADLARLNEQIMPVLLQPSLSDAAVDYRFLTKHRGWRWISNTFSVVRDTAGRAVSLVGSCRDITERREFLDQLRESEQRLLLAQKIAHLGSWEANMVAAQLWLSAEMCRIFGLPPTQTTISFSHMVDLIFAEDRPIAERIFNDLAAHGSGTGDLRLQRPDGELRHVSIQAEAVRDTTDTMTGIVGTALDITERKHAQAALERSEKLYHTLASNFPNGSVYLFDRNARILLAAGQGMALVGLTPELTTNRALDDVFGAGAISCAMRELFTISIAGRPGSDEVFINGRWRMIQTVPVRDETDQIVGVMAMTQDITERKTADAAVRRSELRLKNAQRIACLGSWEWDVATNRAEWSDEMYKIFGRPTDAPPLGSEALFEYVHPADRTLLYKAVTQLRPGAGADIDVRIARQDGSVRYVNFQLEVLFDADGQPDRVVGTALDITDLKQAQAELQLAHDELERRVEERTLQLSHAKDEAERANAAKSEFLSRMSHELRTPMNSILGFAQIMEMDVLSERQVERIGHVMKAGQHLLRLINEVLDLARVESGRLDVSPEPVSVTRVIETACGLIRPQIQQRSQMLANSCVGLEHLYVQADQQRLAQVLLNLLSNASKYSGARSKITISCAERPAGMLRLSVTDTGPGIAPENLSRLFVPFERLAAAASTIEGTGLGLALSRRLVELMGGTMGVDTVLGQGSCFWLELPAATAPFVQLTGAPLAADPVEALRQQHTVLYIEDNLANLEVIEHVLGSQPHIQLLSALQGQIGLDLALQHQPSLILLDMHLPDIGGDEVLRRLRENPATAEVPIVMISADATPNQIRRALAAGATEYLTKPLDIRLFMERVTSLLRAADQQPA